MKKRNIFQNQSQEILTLFETAEDRSKVMCVPMMLKHVFFGGEDCGSYADNFITTLRSENWLVAGVNARDAKTYRENMQAGTDCLVSVVSDKSQIE